MADTSWRYRPRDEWRPYESIPVSRCRRSDEAILDDLTGQLADHPGLNATDIDVTVQEGCVTLRGVVPSHQQKRMAEAIAGATPGVRDIVDRLRSLTEDTDRAA